MGILDPLRGIKDFRYGCDYWWDQSGSIVYTRWHVVKQWWRRRFGCFHCEPMCGLAEWEVELMSGSPCLFCGRDFPTYT